MTDDLNSPAAEEDRQTPEGKDGSIGGDESLQPLTFWQVVGGVLSMAIGVQSEKRRIRDFSRGKFIHFAIAGLIFAFLFILSIATVVVLILS